MGLDKGTLSELYASVAHFKILTEKKKESTATYNKVHWEFACGWTGGIGPLSCVCGTRLAILSLILF